MAVCEITQHRFEMLVDTRDPIAPFFVKERAWFATDGEKSLGAVIYDQIDKDWGYVIMERAEDNRFRWVAGNVSIDSEEEATAQLKKALEER